MDQLARGSIAASETSRRSLADIGLNTPRPSISRKSLDGFVADNERMQLNPVLDPGPSVPQMTEDPDGNQSQRQTPDLRPSLPPLRPFLGESAFSPPQSPQICPRVDARVNSIHLPRHKALAFYPLYAGSLELPDSAKQADSPPDSPGSAAYSTPLASRRPSLIKNHLHETQPHENLAVHQQGDRPPQPLAKSQDHRNVMRPHYAVQRYAPYESSHLLQQQTPEYAAEPQSATTDRWQYPINMTYQQHMTANGIMPGSEMVDSQGRVAVLAYESGDSRARKRSNLPKHSTEILKRWFDAHIDSPYPSEEEKQQFAVAANINMTQVSNWFINHRRRCPELKQKREKDNTSRANETQAQPQLHPQLQS